MKAAYVISRGGVSDRGSGKESARESRRRTDNILLQIVITPALIGCVVLQTRSAALITTDKDLLRSLSH